jgi:phosphate transport system substrate-binding protein
MINPGSDYERIDIVGSTSVQPVAEKLANEFMKKHPNVVINVQAGGSAMGIRSTDQGIADIGMSSMDLNKNETDITGIPIGKEGIVISVNNENNITELSTEEVKNIFNGKISNWKELGGSDLEIHVITREDGSGTRSAFEDLVMDNTKIKADAIVQSSTESIKQSVSKDKGAIGFISLSHMDNEVKALSIDGISPSEETIIDGSYKLQRPFLFLIKGEKNGIVEEFLDWVYSPQGSGIIKSEKLIPSTV